MDHSSKAGLLFVALLSITFNGAASFQDLDHTINSSIVKNHEGMMLDNNAEQGYILYDIEPPVNEIDSVTVGLEDLEHSTVYLQLYLDKENSGQGGITDEVVGEFVLQGNRTIELNESMDDFNSLHFTLKRRGLDQDSPLITDIMLNKGSNIFTWTIYIIIMITLVGGGKIIYSKRRKLSRIGKEIRHR